MASLYNITSRADLDSIKGTAEHKQFMQMLRGTLFNVTKGEKAWEAVESNQTIDQFGFDRKDFEPIELPVFPEFVPSPTDAEIKAAQAESNRRAAYTAESDPLFFKHQRGEVEKQVWLDKIAEIKARFP